MTQPFTRGTAANLPSNLPSNLPYTLPPPVWNARCKACWFMAGLLALVVASFWSLDLQWAQFFSQEAAASMGRFIGEFFPPDLSPAFLRKVGLGMAETLAMSLLGTLLAVVAGLALALPASKVQASSTVLVTSTVRTRSVVSSKDPRRWPTAYGPGRPGWHLECSAMAGKYLGDTFDIHGGGVDLRFPHHAYEAAQAEAATGVTPFARSWLHVGTVRLDGEKMAKSTGNLVFARDLLQRSSGPVVRTLLLDRRYATPWDFTEAGLEQAAVRLDALHAAAGRPAGPASAQEAVLDALVDDLDVPRALDIAIEDGGQAARDLVGVLALQ